MDRLSATLAPAPQRPVKVLQYGEGNLLRAFVDYFMDIANEKTGFNNIIGYGIDYTWLTIVSIESICNDKIPIFALDASCYD